MTGNMSTTTKLINIIGIQNAKSVKPRMVILAIISIYVLIQSILSITLRWDEIDVRYVSLEDFNDSLFSAAVILDFSLIPSNIHSLIEVANGQYFDENYNSSESKQTMIYESNIRERIVVNRLKIIFTIFFINLSIPSLVITIFNSVIDKNGSKRYPFEGIYPFDSNSDVYFIPLYLFQCFYCLLASINAFCIMSASIISMYHFTNEIKLFCISLKEIDVMVKRCSAGQRSVTFEYSLNFENFNRTFNKQSEYQLHKYIIRLIEHHQFIYKMQRRLNKSLSIISLFLNQAVGLLGCMCLFWIVESKTVLNMAEYGFFLTSATMVLYLYMYNGQTIVDEGENMRRVLYECSWLDKPKWFKDSILMMMIRSTKPMGVQPFGIKSLTLNMETFAMVMRAAYTYFNVLKTFQSK